jgi:hypothetical protein
MPGKQVENLLISIKKSQAFCTGTSRSIFPSRIIRRFPPTEIQARSYARKFSLTRGRSRSATRHFVPVAQSTISGATIDGEEDRLIEYA